MPFFPEQASSFAPHVDALYGFMIAVTAFFSLLIGTLVVVFAIKYHRKSPDEVATEVHESGALEIAWTIIPFGIVLVMFYLGRAGLLPHHAPAGRRARDLRHGQAVDVEDPALRRPPGDERAARSRGPPVRLTMASEDVIHSFFVPAFRFKRDVVPGRFATAWFEATKPGKYHLFCAEFCGTRHSGMIGWVYVMKPPEYQAWLSGGVAGESLAAAGAKRFVEHACNTCHGDQPGARGPVAQRDLRQARAGCRAAGP